jgi:hypothetical protein
VSISKLVLVDMPKSRKQCHYGLVCACIQSSAACVSLRYADDGYSAKRWQLKLDISALVRDSCSAKRIQQDT